MLALLVLAPLAPRALVSRPMLRPVSRPRLRVSRPRSRAPQWAPLLIRSSCGVAAPRVRGKPICARKARAGVNHGPSLMEAPHDSSPVTRRTQHILEVVECREWRVSPVFSLYISFSTRAVTLISVVCKGRTHRHKSHTRHTHTHSSQLSHSSHVTADSATHSTTQRRFSFSL